MTAAVASARAPDLRAPLDLAYRGQPVLAATGAFLALCMVPTFAALLLDARLFNDIPIWIKPLKFQASLALQLLTIALLASLLPAAVRAGRQVRWTSAAAATAAVFEAGYIALRAAQGAPSHFATTSPLATTLYQLMGLGAVVLVGSAVWIGVLLLRHGKGPRVIVVGAGLGLVLGGLLGGVTGAAISVNAGHWVGGAATDAGGLPIVGWARDGGDLRVAHFFGLHLMQVVPIAALLLWAGGVARWRAPLYAAAAIGVTVSAATLLQAWAGRPFP